MSRKTEAIREMLCPDPATILVRVVFLYVGQGSSTIVFMAYEDTFRVWLVDINLDRANGGIDVPSLMKDLLDRDSLHAFVNTHPHDDHLRGLSDLSSNVTIDNVFHSGHIPSKQYGSLYSELMDLVKKVKSRGGQEVLLEGSRSAEREGHAYYHMLAPAKHITDDVNDESSETRRARIHEQCGVIKFGDLKNWVMIVGDADRTAFEEHITQYHRERLRSFALAASHHGSRSFFKHDKDDDPYLDGLQKIDPDFVVVSAPLSSESRHEHPHEDAMTLYRDHVGDEGLFHTGEERLSFIVDIYKDETRSGVVSDEGKLSEKYGLESDERVDESKAAAGPFPIPERPFSPKPRTFG